MPQQTCSLSPWVRTAWYDINHDTGAKILGDIVLSVEMAMAQAKRYGHSLEREIGYLTAHSMLHLLGYDHENGGMERVRMREKEEYVMSQTRPAGHFQLHRLTWCGLENKR